MNITNFVVSHRDNALLIGDYKTYHHQLTKQLASLRKRLGRATSKNAKFSKKAAVTAEDVGRNKEFAHLLILSAERAFAHAMSMKTSGTEDGTGLPGATRQHIANRMHKAATHAQQLAELLANIADIADTADTGVTKATEGDVLEAKAYAFTLAGAEQLEKHGAGNRSSNVETQRAKWGTCLEKYSAARVIYIALLKTTRDDVFKEYVASTIDPSIRFAAYQSHIPRTVPPVTVSRKCFPQDETELVTVVEKLDPAAFDDKKAAGSDGAVDIPNTITWRSRQANIVDASIGQALAAVSTETGRLEEALEDDDVQDKSAAYDPVLIAAQDAADATRRAIDDHEKEKISEADPRMQDLRVTNLAVNYDLIGWRVGRNRVLIGADDGATLSTSVVRKPKKPRKDGKEWSDKVEGHGRKLARLRERIVLYDAILQSLDSVKEVPGAMRDTAFVEELEGKKAYFQALKCLNVSFSHTIVSSPSHRNALALIVRAEEFSSAARKNLGPSAPTEESTPLRLDISSSRLQNLHSLIQRTHLHTRALVELHNHTANSAIAARKNLTNSAPTVESLTEYPGSGKVDLTRLVEWPPKLKPVPVKPLFFDTAWNYVEYPGRTPAASATASKGEVNGAKEEPQQPASRGWFGFGRR